jgi:hypothetical protein
MWKNILLFSFIVLTALMGFACGRKEISIPILIKIPPNLKPWPFQAALIIPPETKNFHYWSPDAGPSAGADTLRPFTLPVGRAFAAAAQETFSQLFQEVTVKNQWTAADRDRLVVESDLEEFSLEMEYVSLSPQPHDTFLDLKGKIKARVRVTRPGKDFWENTAVADIPATRLIVNPWTDEAIGKLVADGLSSLYEKILQEAGPRPEKPAIPFHIWLTP